MQYYLAPLEGITTYVYRNAYHKHFKKMDKYFTPFIVPHKDKKFLQELENDTVSITQGGTVEGPLTLLSDPTEEFHAITKSYLEKIVGDLGNLTVVEYIKKKNSGCFQYYTFIVNNG